MWPVSLLLLVPWNLVASEWVEISQNHYRKTLRPYTNNAKEQKNKVYPNISIAHWDEDVKGNVDKQKVLNSYEEKYSVSKDVSEEKRKDESPETSVKFVPTTERATYKYSGRPLEFYGKNQGQEITSTKGRTKNKVNRTSPHRSKENHPVHKGHVVKISKEEIGQTPQTLKDKSYATKVADRRSDSSADDTSGSEESDNRNTPARKRFVAKVESVDKPGSEISTTEPKIFETSSPRVYKPQKRPFPNEIPETGGESTTLRSRPKPTTAKAKNKRNNTDHKKQHTTTTPSQEDTEMVTKKKLLYKPNRIYLFDITPKPDPIDIYVDTVDTTTAVHDDDVTIETIEEKHVIRNDKVPFDRLDILKLTVPEEPGFVTKQDVLETISEEVENNPINSEEGGFDDTSEEASGEASVDTEEIVDQDATVIEEASEQLSNTTKPNPIENILKVMKVVSDTISRNSQTLKSKVKYLQQLRDSIMNNIISRIDALWPDDAARPARRARSHVEFPSSESALMTISFLTFAVFLIKLVLQVMLTYKNKTMMTPAVFAVSRAAAAAAAHALTGAQHDHAD